MAGFAHAPPSASHGAVSQTLFVHAPLQHVAAVAHRLPPGAQLPHVSPQIVDTSFTQIASQKLKMQYGSL
jgi:hypothetical protein